MASVTANQGIQRIATLEGPAQILAPKHTALLVLDMQNDFCAPGGKVFDSLGPKGSVIRAIVAPIRDLVARARECGLLTVYVQTMHLKGGVDESPAYISSLKAKGFQIGDEPNVVEGSWGHRIIDELAPPTDAVLVQKYNFDAFHNSLLDPVLRNYGVRSVLMVGAATYGVVLTTARTAFCRGYYVRVVKECVAGYGEELNHAALKLMEGELVSTEEVLRAWGYRS